MGNKLLVKEKPRSKPDSNIRILRAKRHTRRQSNLVDSIDQGANDDHTTGNVGNDTYIPPINWHPQYYIVTLSTIDTENANGIVQVTGQNGALMITLNGTGDQYSQFKMCEGDIQNDHESKDPNQLYTVICLESCAYPGNYLCWASIPKHHIESVGIQPCTGEGNKPPTNTREIAWFRQPTQPPKCDQNDYCSQDSSQDRKQTNRTEHSGGVPAFSVGANSSDIHKLAAWTQPPPCDSNSDDPYYYLTFENIQHAPQGHKPKLTPEFSLSDNILFTNVTQLNN